MNNKKGIVYFLLDKKEEICKIGYTENLNKRMKHYRTHNPNVELVYSIQGCSRETEAYYHRLFWNFRIEGNGTKEWFQAEPVMAHIKRMILTEQVIRQERFLK